MSDLFDDAYLDAAVSSLNVNAVLVAVCRDKTILHTVAASLSVTDEELSSFLVNHIFVTDGSVKVGASASKAADIHESEPINTDESSDDVMSGQYESAVLHTDGGSRGNPGIAGCGMVIEYDGGPKVGYSRYLGIVTNNEAEYAGLVNGLTLLRDKNVKNVSAFADSELMCNQINGKYKVKHPTLKKYYDQAMDLIAGFDSFSLTHVLREKNKDADKMANVAMDTKKDGETKFTVAG